jgi:hypothetical protein
MIERKKIIFSLVGLVILGLLAWLVYRFISAPAGSSQTIDKIKKVINLPSNQGDGKNTNNANQDQSKINYVFREGDFIKLLTGLTAAETAILQESKNYLYISKINDSCQKEIDKQKKEVCFNDLKFYEANLIGRPELCDQVGESRDACLLNMAFRYDKLTICDLIKNTSLKNSCQGSF